MNENLKKMNIPFSPPDITESEVKEVIDTLKSGWITTGPKTKELEKLLTACPQDIHKLSTICA